MRHIIIILVCLLNALCMQAQTKHFPRFSPYGNQRLQQFYQQLDAKTEGITNELLDLNFELEYINNQDGLKLQYYISHKWPDQYGFIELLDELSHEAVECYHSEVHLAEEDTINYALLFNSDDGRLEQDTYENRPIFAAKNSESVYYTIYGQMGTSVDSLIYHEKNGKMEKQLVSTFIPDRKGGYADLNHSIMIDSTHIATEPLNINAFCNSIASVLQQKNVKMRKVHYLHDDAMTDVERAHVENIIYFESDPDIKRGDTYGLHYFVQSEEQGIRMLQQLQETIDEYLVAHPNETYSFRPVSSLNKYNHYAGSFILESIIKDKPINKFDILARRESNGSYHFFLLNTEGELWIPDDCGIVKEYHNFDYSYYEDDRMPGMEYDCDGDNKK